MTKQQKALKKFTWDGVSHYKLKKIMKEQKSVLPNAIKEYNKFIREFEKNGVGKFFKEGNKLHFIAKKEEESKTFLGITLTEVALHPVPDITVGYIRPKNSCWKSATKKEFFKLLDGIKIIKNHMRDNADTLPTRLFTGITNQYHYHLSPDPHSSDIGVSIKPNISFDLNQERFVSAKEEFNLFSIPDLKCWECAVFAYKQSITLTEFNKYLKPLFRIKWFVNKTTEEANGKKQA